MPLNTTVFHRLQELRILVIGDVMLDRYLWGEVSRISPEAPVPIVDVMKEENRLGGAANVAVNLRHLGATPVLCGCVGTDRYAELFAEALQKQGFTDAGIFSLASRPTTVKARVIGGSQQMLRVDTEQKQPLSDNERQQFTQRLAQLLDQPFDAVVFEDYDKGLLDLTSIQTVIAKANERGIPVLVDPKFRNFFAYSGVTVFKPNVKELNEALGLHLKRNDIPAIVDAVNQLRATMPHDSTLVTLSEYGVLWVDANGKPSHYPAFYRQIVDVSGAGDTVIATLAALVAAGANPPEAARIANLAGGLVCEQVGVVPIDRDQLEDEASRHGLIENAPS